MRVVEATKADIAGWSELAAEVEYLFGPMVDDPKFRQALENNIHRQSAFCVRENDGPPGSGLLGGLLFSPAHAPKYRIGWLSVASRARNRGIASALLHHVLDKLEVPAEISVTTFGEDIPDGRPARGLYQKFGFIPLEEPVPNGPEGGSRQRFRLVMPFKRDGSA